jgi:PAS domain S-box-containing protein
MTPDKVAGKKCYELIGRDETCDNCATMQCLSSKRIEEIERYEEKYQSWLNIRAYPVLDNDGNIIKIVEHLRDITKEKNYEKALVESEERFRSIVHGSPLGIYIYELQHDNNLILIDANPAADLFTNANNQNLIGQKIEEAFPGLANTEIPDRYRQAAKDGIPWQTQEVVYQDEHISGAFEVHAFQTTQNRVAVMFFDITDRKIAAKKLEKSEQNYRELFNSISDAVFVHDPETGQIYDVNDTMLSMFGFTYEEALSSTIGQLSLNHPPYDQKTALEWIQKATREGFVEFEWKSRRKNGEEFWVDINLLYRTLGDHKRILAVVRDITQRKEAEEKLKYQYAFETLITSISTNFINLEVKEIEVGIYDALKSIAKFLEADRSFIIEHSQNNTNIENIYGYYHNTQKTLECLCGKSLNHFSYINSLISQGRPVHIPSVQSLPETAKNEQEYWIENGIESLVLEPLFLSGKVIGSIGIDSFSENKNWSKDVCTLLRNVGVTIQNAIERKRSEEERLKLQEQIQQSQKIESIGLLAGGIAHDFNNLLMSIIGYCDLANEQLPKNHPVKDDLKEILDSGERAAALTRQLLAFSRKQILNPKEINLNKLLLNMDKMLRRLIGENIELITKPDPNLGYVKVDPNQIEQIILNLAVNAKDAMPNGGKLIIESTNTLLDSSYTKNKTDIQAGDYVMIAVSDNGYGIPEENVQKIFEPFFTTKDKSKGTGLGLSTVYGIIKQSGGHIMVYSEVNKGTTFKIYLPLIKTSTSNEDHVQESQIQLRGSESILVVEDEDSVRSLVTNILQDYGYSVLTQESCESALETISSNQYQFDMLITDVILPKQSGRELADRILEYFPDIKILFMSGYTDDAIVHHGILEEGLNFLQKPFPPRTLLQKIRGIFDS